MKSTTLLSRILWTTTLLAGMASSAHAVTRYIYDFEWYAGAAQPWVYDAAQQLTLEVYADPNTPENDVYFTMRNLIDTELGTGSSIGYTQIDTGTDHPDLFDSLEIWDASPGVNFYLKMVGDPYTYSLIDLAASRIAWDGEYAPQKFKDSSPKTDGINPEEYVTFRAILKEGLTFDDLIALIEKGLVTQYVNSGSWDNWSQDDKDNYRAQAPAGLRFTYLVHSIVPNSWNPDGHGLFVINTLVRTSTNEFPTITQLTAQPSTISDAETSTLTVMASDADNGPEPLSYRWEIVSGSGTLSDPYAATTTFTPDNIMGTENVVIRVKVSDGDVTIQKELTVEVNDTNIPPSITVVTVDPSELTDKQVSHLTITAMDPDNGPQPLSYQWRVLSGGGSFDDPTSTTPVYTPDDVTGTQRVTIEVTVSDGDGTARRQVELQITDGGTNEFPVINALTAQPPSLLDTQTSQLSVSASDPDNAPSPLSYHWRIISGGGQLDSATSPTPVYTPIDVTGLDPTSVTIEVEVSDGEASVTQRLTLAVHDGEIPPPERTLFYDNFDDEEPLDLNVWEVWDKGTVSPPSEWRPRYQKLAQLSNIGEYDGLDREGTYLLYKPGMNWTDYAITFDLSSTDDDAIGLMFRYVDDNNYYRFSWDAQRQFRQLVKKENGVFTLLASDNVPYEKSQEYHVKIVAQGPQLQVWVDDQKILEVTDNSFSQGSFAPYSSVNQGAYFDNIIIENLSANALVVDCQQSLLQLTGNRQFTNPGNTMLASTTAIELPETGVLSVGADHQLTLQAPEIRIRPGSNLQIAPGAELHLLAQSVDCNAL